MPRLSLLSAALLFTLAACAAPQRADTTASALDTDRQSCVKACNAAYERCGDTNAARRTSSDIPPDLFGARADCKSSLRNCLPRCKGR